MVPGVAEEQGTSAVLQQFRHLIGVKRVIQRNCSASRGNDAQVNCYPPRMIVSENRDSGARLKSIFDEPMTD